MLALALYPVTENRITNLSKALRRHVADLTPERASVDDNIGHHMLGESPLYIALARFLRKYLKSLFACAPGMGAVYRVKVPNGDAESEGSRRQTSGPRNTNLK